MTDDVLTLEKLKAVIAALPPTPPKQTFASCRLFPANTAYRFHGDDLEEFAIAHPDFWTAALHVQKVPDFKCTPFGLGGIEVVNLDTNPGERERVMTQMQKAMERATGQEDLRRKYSPAWPPA